MYKYSILFLFVCSSISAYDVSLYQVKYEGPLSLQFMKMIKETFDLDCFVETGTFGGDTTLKAAKIFPYVHTIELLPRYFEQNKIKFAAYHNITAHFGDSGTVLSKLAQELMHNKCAFFLDAHYAGEDTAKGDGNTPLVAEVRAICSASTSHIIIIDDIRLCQSDEHIINKQRISYPDETTVFGYPSLIGIVRELKHYNEAYELFVVGDVGLAIPMNIYPNLTIAPIIKAMTASRFFEEYDEHTFEELRNVMQLEQQLMKAEDHEVVALLDLVYCMQPELYTAHYKLWLGLMFLGQSEPDKALSMFEKAHNAGFKHWRLDYYISCAQEKAGNFEQAQATLQQVYASMQHENVLVLDIPFTQYL